ncbi:HIT family protein [Pseudobdellovibrio exovorus]|uniref:Hit family hydrolase n=1 Tax=Pseudobdellovibrio exovorus JSS TaxID=1184267 RepID=M4V6R6_9BACT|nr:HIT domain-containing protein [Pseudobdellovibrio exovorus]AGH95057.1 hit family hydrolase [Pseudobdellovibrio exovorus JSS]
MAKKKSPTTKKTKSKKSSSKKAKTDGWPNQRNIFFRPERLKYVRKMVKTSGCVFCNSANKPESFETLCVYKSQHSQIVLNKYPYNNGHLLVLPLEHVGQILELSPERYDDLHRTLRLAIQAIQDIYAPNGMNIGMNHGASGGAGIPEHLHYHIVPRWNGDLNFFPLIAGTKLVMESLDDTYARLTEYFSKIEE